MDTPILFTLFGASGDLAKLKIFPSLFGLFRHGLLPEQFSLVGFARTRMTRSEFQTLVGESLSQMCHTDDDTRLLESFLETVWYTSGSYDNPTSYTAYLDFLSGELGLDIEHSTHLIYLSVPPHVSPWILDNLSHVLDTESQDIRIILEKPFGQDESGAIALFDHLTSLYPSHSLYLLDHYLGKQTLRDLSSRDGKSFLSRFLTPENIESIEVSAIERVDVSERVGFFDEVGTLKDMIQSHLFQMLAYTLIDTTSESLSEKKMRVLSLLSFDEAKNHLLLGQYDTYTSHDEKIRDSQTETYVAIELSLTLDGVVLPVFLRSGKSLHEKSTYIHVTLSEAIRSDEGCESVTIDITKNTVILTGVDSKHQEISLSRNDICSLYNLDAHEALFLDVMEGNHTFFLTESEILSAWKIVDRVIAYKQRENILPGRYVSYSYGPESAALFHNWYR